MKYNINDLTLKEKFGQMIILGLDVDDVDQKIFDLIREYQIGGVVLYKKNYHSVDEMINLINKIKITNIPMFIAIDQENGVVNRLPNEIQRLPSPRKQVELGIVDECNEITIDILEKLGVNMNLAPVLDVNRNPKSRINGTRSYSANYKEVIKYGKMTIKKYHERGIIPVGKHFPGHGLVRGDSHFVLPMIKDLELLEVEDCQVFKKLIDDGLEVLMLGHLRVKGYGFKPVTMNKEIIKNYLSNYQGLIMTDDIQMNYLKYLYGLKKVFLNCLEAGNDLIMIKYQSEIYQVFEEILNKISQDQYLKDVVNESVQKILNIKEKYQLTNDQVINKFDISEINKKIVKLNSSD